jgi:hypothetical protein
MRRVNHMSDNEFKKNMKNLVNALQNVCRAYSEIPDILEFEGRLSIFDKKFESIDKGDMTLLMSLFDMRVESGEVKQSSDNLGYHIAKAVDRLEYLLSKDDVREFLQGYFEEDFPNPVEDYVRAVMETIRGREDSDDIITALRCVIDGVSEKERIINRLETEGESDERAKEVANKIDILDKFKLLKYYYGWSVKELYEEYVKNALEDYE